MNLSSSIDAKKSIPLSPATNMQLLLPYAAPYFVYVAAGTLQGSIPIEWIYAFRLIVVPALILWAWRRYIPIWGPNNRWVSMGVGVLIGLAGTAVWIGLLHPFVPDEASAWGRQAFYLRTTASTLVVPVFEELFMRGYVFLLVLQWDRERKKGTSEPLDKTLNELSIWDVRQVSWNLPAIAISTLAFTLGHQFSEWPASIAYGTLMAILLVVRKDLWSCMAAHATTNLCLALFVNFTGSWQYW
jgi:CAAX protease family protein